MIRRYCDACGELITDSRSANRIKREHYIEPGRIVSVEVMVAWNKCWNSGDICTPCVLRAVSDGVDIR